MIIINKRKKEWQKEVNEGIKNYENKTKVEYDYYGNISRHKKIKWKKGINIGALLRYTIGILMIIYTVLRHMGKI